MWETSVITLPRIYQVEWILTFTDIFFFFFCSVLCSGGLTEYGINVCCAHADVNECLTKCNQVTTLWVTSLPWGMAASKANMRLMNAFHCIWVHRRHAKAHAYTQWDPYSTDPSFRSLLPAAPELTMKPSVSLSGSSVCSPPWPFPVIRDGNRHRFASLLILQENLWLTHTGWVTASSCSPQSTAEVQLRVVELCHSERKKNKLESRCIEGWKREEVKHVPASYVAHTHTNTHTYGKARWLTTEAELLWRGEYYPLGTSFTSSIFTEFLCVLLLLIIQANCTHITTSHTSFMSVSVVRVIIELIMGRGWYSHPPPLRFHSFCWDSEFWRPLIKG